MNTDAVARAEAAPAASAAPADRLKITEIFLSLQGEARDAGWPTVFVRLTGCPLRCQYCDTAYAFYGGQWRSIEDILALQQAAARITCQPEVTAYAVRITRATRTQQGLSLGAGTRGAISLVRTAKAMALLAGRSWTLPDDVKAAALPVLRHRVALAPELQISGQDADSVLTSLLRSVPAPR